MPVGALKNTLYGMALPIAGKRCTWSPEPDDTVRKALHRAHAVGACVQRFSGGRLTDCITAGYASLDPEPCPVTPDTVFRTASVAKMVSAMLVMRLQTLGRLSAQEDVSDFLGFRVRNPQHPDRPITLAMLLSHTSSVIDSPAYYDSFSKPVPLSALLAQPSSFSGAEPGKAFVYSNLAAGMIGCLLEKRFGESFEALAQRELFAPLGIEATYDPSRVPVDRAADSWRVLPAAKALDVKARIRRSVPITEPDPETHYLLASGNLYITAPELARLALVAVDGGGFLDEKSVRDMQTPCASWPRGGGKLRHGLGILMLDDPALYPQRLYGHQGFAYGAVNGVFFDGNGNGFASLNSGASEQRTGHLAVINRDLIRLT